MEMLFDTTLGYNHLPYTGTPDGTLWVAAVAVLILVVGVVLRSIRA